MDSKSPPPENPNGQGTEAQNSGLGSSKLSLPDGKGGYTQGGAPICTICQQVLQVGDILVQAIMEIEGMNIKVVQVHLGCVMAKAKKQVAEMELAESKEESVNATQDEEPKE